MTSGELLLGVDGGGTATVAWLSASGRGDDDPLGRGRAGPSNPRAVGFERGLANLDVAIDAAFADAGRDPGPVASACLALAGADRESERGPLRAWATARGLSERLRIVNDAEPVLACGAHEGWGVALISGTGSLAYGRNRDGETGRAGGWGHLMGDEGSGYAIAIAALRAAARCADGRGRRTTLLPTLLEALGATDPFELIEIVHGRPMDRRAIADLAPLVFDTASEDDDVALTIVDGAANDLSAMVAAVCERLRLTRDGFDLALGGGILCARPSFRDRVTTRLRDRGWHPRAVEIVADPVRGALHLARE